MKIVTITLNSTIDLNTSVNHVIAENKLRCRVPNYDAGGGGLNVSRAIKKLGGNSLAIYLAGGANGKVLNQLLDKEEINQVVIQIKGMTRENITVSEEISNQQYRFVMPGPELNKDEWEKCFEILNNLNEKLDYIVASGSLPKGVPEDFYARVAKVGTAKNIRVIVDTSGKALYKAVEEGVFLIKPNMREINDIAEKPIHNEKDLIEFSRHLLKNKKAENVVISLGAGGALLISNEKVLQVKSPTVPIRSKVGAGDSMTAGIVLSLERGKSVYEAVKFGVAAGAAAVMSSGTELCGREDTERLYLNMNSLN